MDAQEKKLVEGFGGYALAALMIAYADAKSRGDAEMRRIIDGALQSLETTAADAAKSPMLRPIYDAARQHLEELLAIGP